jgi:hypothetical protein
MASMNKSLAQSNKSCMGTKATKRSGERHDGATLFLGDEL